MVLRGLLKLVVTFCLAVLLSSADPVNPSLGSGDDAFVSRQSTALLAEIDKTLDAVPPAIPEPRERVLALRILDAVLHDTHSPNRVAVQEF